MTKEQIAKAKEWDLLSYLQTYEPQELKQCGPREYCTRTHDSLKISNGKWCWNSRGIGGRTALDYLIKVRGMDFVDAVEALCGSRAPPPPERPRPKPPKPFQLPEATRFPAAVVAYLQDRGIHPELIGACLQAGTLYESRKHQNCVFVGKDPEGRARSACLRGTRDRFRLDVEGSDKRYHFALLAAGPDCPRLAAAESPIDALSLATLVKLAGGEWWDSHYLSLGGTTPRALLQFLYDHPHVTQVSLCLDNDKAGLEGMERLERAIREDAELSRRVRLIYRNPPPVKHGKDYNEFLCACVQAARARQRQREGAR
ncbi:toprim domain-containing protein [Pseudoflavonifractor sp. 524-17]|uniref:toprim domain-containing protein n=1 Tax=Pseudoflavonifractor sp. 524-17 TaxID=2304577 RepID=UPI00325BEEA9